LKKELGLEPELIRGSGGVFEIELDGKLIFSKKKLGRFPEDGEVAGLINKEK
jgi:selenoprotein W-related protein